MSPLWILLVLLPVLGGAERFKCRGRILGAYYADAKSGCKAFHVCVRVAGGGIRDFRFFCPPGTLFHQEAQTCTDWGDDDPLACPADLYDGQFDLYKIGSGFDTKKVSSSVQKPNEDESEFGLQRAESGDRRNQNNDLRAAHSSDFFSGQRDRGRDDSQNYTPSPTSARQSFRRQPAQRTPTTTTQYPTQSPSSPQYSAQPAKQSPQPPAPPKYSPQPTSPPQYSPQPTKYSAQLSSAKYSAQPNSDKYTDQSPSPKYSQQYEQSSKRKLVRKRPVYHSTPAPTFPTTQSPQPFSEQPRQNYRPQPQNYRPQPQPQPQPSLPPPDLPAQYKDEYVEVPRVTPKPSRYFASPTPYTQSTSASVLKNKDGLVELFNYNSQSTPAIAQNDKVFKLRNSLSVTDVSRENEFPRNTGRSTASTTDYTTNKPRSQQFVSSTPAQRNFNSVSYESEKNNYVQYNTKQHYYSQSTSPTTVHTVHTTTRNSPAQNFNTAAYNTNNGFNIQSSNYPDAEDDGQYRLPPDEDDGQYRPELYERELLSGAHSLNIAASGNRLPEDQKPKGKVEQQQKPISQTAVPRPFRPSPTPTLPPQTRVPEPSTVNNQRTFDYYQTYTTTLAPRETPAPVFPPYNPVPSARPTTTSRPEPRPQTKPAAPAYTHEPEVNKQKHQQNKTPSFAKPASQKEDNSYDYAYYDSDPGLTEYDQIEEFGRTKSKV